MTQEQRRDYELCADLFFLLGQNFLMFPQKDFPKVSAYFAFESEGLCINQAEAS